MQQAVQTIAVIGAGASGLVAIKHLREAGYDVTCFEQDSTIAGTFQNKAYDDSCLVSSKYITPFSDLRLGAECCAHQSLPDYCAYLQGEESHLKSYYCTMLSFTCSNTNDLSHVY
jgi:dimethylaniline monooxygenase (N-oxide forming)